jgi:hypothetical protein
LLYCLCVESFAPLASHLALIVIVANRLYNS